MVPLNLLKQNILIWLLLTRLHSLWKLAAGYLYCGLQGTSTFLAALRLWAHISNKHQSWEKQEWKPKQRKNFFLSLPQSLLPFIINLHNLFFSPRAWPWGNMDDWSWSGLHCYVCEKTLGVLNTSDFMAPPVLCRHPFGSSQRQLLEVQCCMMYMLELFLMLGGGAANTPKEWHHPFKPCLRGIPIGFPVIIIG